MLRYIRRYWKWFTFSVFLLTIEALVDLSQPTLMANIIDHGVVKRNTAIIWQFGGWMLLLTAVGAVTAMGRNLVASRTSQRLGTALRADLYRKIQSLSFANIDQFERASLITRMTNDVTQVQNFLNGLMRIFVKAPLVGLGALFMAYQLNPRLAIVPLVVMPIVAGLVALNVKVGFPRFTKVQRALDHVNRVVREYLSGVRVVKAFNRFQHETEKLEEAGGEYRDRSIQAMRATVIFNPATMLTVQLGIVAILWLGAVGVNNGQTQVGHIIAFTNYMTQILFALMVVSMIFNMFVRARASSVRIDEVFAQVNTMKWQEGTEPVVRGRIDFEDVSFAYEGSAPVLKHITFTCLPGETVGIIGPTGSGKSTLVNLIPRFYDATAGMVKVNGVDVREMNPYQLREKIAIVPQTAVLFTGTILDNIRWGKEDATQEEVEQAAKLAEAHGFISDFSDGYQTRVGQRGVNLSGGQKQRISIARAWIRQPDILILDDATSAVDVVTEASIKRSLKREAQQCTCLIIAQRITSVMDADKVVVLDDGEIVGMGTHDELLETCTVYQEIFHSQLGRGETDGNQ